MKKKYLLNAMLLSATMLTTACFLGGCADNSIKTVSSPNESETVEDETGINEEKTTKISIDSEEDLTYSGSTRCLVYSDDVLKHFSYALFAENMDEENPVISPVSAYIALSMAGLGAENNTKSEFEAVLGDYSDMTDICDNLMNTLPTSSENNIITLACSAWVDDEMNVYDSWISDIDTIMHSEVFQGNLSTRDTVTQMNNWIEDKTNGLIEQMLNKPLSEDTRLVLFNTVYFKAKWASGFDAVDTYDDKFYPEKCSEPISTEMMHKSDENMDYISNDFAEGIIFPYRNWEDGDGNFALVALKPLDDEKTIREIYSELTHEVIGDLLESRQTVMVNTKLPKFEMTFDKSLNESLISMGLIDAFRDGVADFGKIGATDLDNGIYIDLVRQKSKIIVDEEGTEAAAATEVMMVECTSAFIEENPIEVYFDSPFIYIIMDMDKEIPLFIGILDTPAPLLCE